ncbi:MAG: multidrug efflux SMR transporter [Gammaproteobacteria bacterium]|jgi:quaternary ammonium compound-resistance protein SugE
MNSYWLYLALSGVTEIGLAVVMKQSDGMTRLLPTLGVVVLGVASIWLFSLALRSIPIGTAYAVWIAISAVGITFTGIYAYGETMDWLRAVSIALIIIGVVGLKAGSKAW